MWFKENMEHNDYAVQYHEYEFIDINRDRVENTI